MKCRALLSRGASTVQTSAQSSVSGELEMILSTPPQRPLTGWYGGGQRRGLPAQTHASQGEAGTDMSTSWHTYYSRWVVSRRDGRQASSDCLTTTPPLWPGTTSARTWGQMWGLWSTLPTHVILVKWVEAQQFRLPMCAGGAIFGPLSWRRGCLYWTPLSTINILVIIFFQAIS